MGLLQLYSAALLQLADLQLRLLVFVVLAHLGMLLLTHPAVWSTPGKPAELSQHPAVYRLVACAV